jgi:hypothetical protein
MSNLRGALQHGAAYRNTPGKYANVWGAVEVTLTTRPERLTRTFRLARHDLATA